MFDITDTYSDFRDDRYILKDSWFWTKGPAPNACLQQLIKQYKIGSSEHGIYIGWEPMDMWIISEQITIFLGNWVHTAEEYCTSKIPVLYMSIANVDHDICPSIMSRHDDNSESGISEIKRGYSPIKWRLLNDNNTNKYLSERINAKLTLNDLIFNGLTIDRWVNKDLLSYLIKSWWPDVEEYALPDNLLGE